VGKDLTERENVIPGKEKLTYAERKGYLINRNWIVQRGRNC
jgi:hypothetical protein